MTHVCIFTRTNGTDIDWDIDSVTFAKQQYLMINYHIDYLSIARCETMQCVQCGDSNSMLKSNSYILDDIDDCGNNQINENYEWRTLLLPLIYKYV